MRAQYLRLRFQLFGRRKKKFYRIVCTMRRHRRNGPHHEVLGYYYPMPVNLDIGKAKNETAETYKKELLPNETHLRAQLNFERVKYWLARGATPSRPVHRLLAWAGLAFPFPVPPKPQVDASDAEGTLTQLRAWEAQPPPPPPDVSEAELKRRCIVPEGLRLSSPELDALFGWPSAVAAPKAGRREKEAA
eukprot:EG_transcript_25670